MQKGRQGLESPGHAIKKIAVIGISPAGYQGDGADDARVSASRDTSSADNALLEKSYYLTSMLFEAMSGHEGYELISPDSAREASSRISASGEGPGDTETAGRVARELNADAAITGFLYRWKEREGSDYAVNNPASVFFDLCLVSPEDGSILWRGRFKKTQRSLSENLLDIRTFFKGKGKWMTANDLAGMGMNDLISDVFMFMEKGREAEN